MRLAYAVVLLGALACAKSEETTADTTAMAAAPAGLTDADFAGTWTGTAKMEGSDSVALHWTQVCGGGTCKGTSQEMPNDTITSNYTIDADSSHGVSLPYMDQMAKARVVDHWIARVAGSTVTGRGWAVLADKPDSTVMRYTFEGTKR